MEKENHSAEKKPMREYTPWDYVKPGIAIAAFAVGLIFVLFRFDAVSKVGGVLFNAVSSFILGLFIAYILNVFLNLFENTVFGRLTRSAHPPRHHAVCRAGDFQVFRTYRRDGTREYSGVCRPDCQMG